MKKSRKKKQNSFEFSKLIYLINLGFVAIVTGLSFYVLLLCEVGYAKEKNSTALQA